MGGDYADLFTSAGDPISVYDPFGTYTDANGRTLRMPFFGNPIPASLSNPFGPRVGPFWAQPNNPGLEGPTASAPISPT